MAFLIFNDVVMKLVTLMFCLFVIAAHGQESVFKKGFTKAEATETFSYTNLKVATI